MVIPMTVGEKDTVLKGFRPNKCSSKRTRKNGWQGRNSNQCLKAKLMRKTLQNHSKGSQSKKVRSYRTLIKLQPKN